MITKTCLVCQKDYKIFPSRRKDSKYCSIRCFQLTRLKNKEKVCIICSKVFLPQSPFAGRKQKYCSRRCRGVASSQGRIILTKKCLYCDKDFTLLGRGRVNSNKQVFCSKKCYYLHKRLPKKVSNGYIQLYVPVGTPGRKKNGRMWEHRFVIQCSLGRPLKPWEVVHHKNSNRQDNRIENLELVSPQLNAAYSLLKKYKEGV